MMVSISNNIILCLYDKDRRNKAVSVLHSAKRIIREDSQASGEYPEK
jgi:hypothetical protein